ncbi:MAG: M48 family metallopeptidase [Nitrospiraceae bacterium]
MIQKFRFIILSALLAYGFALILGLYFEGTKPPLRSSLAPAFQLLGHATKAVDSLITRVVPVSSLDEQDLGRVIAARYERTADRTDPDFLYLNDLIKHLSEYVKKPFEYRVYVLKWDEPNAMALPGGIILVTKGLLRVMQSETEVVSVLAHEIGHVERGHCFDAVKFELLSRKLGQGTYGQIADIVESLLVRHSFSKTLEDQADEYAYEMLLLTSYDPRGEGEAFSHLLMYLENRHDHSTSQSSRANVLRDYFMSHPPLPLRKEKFSQHANAWWRTHPNERRFVGRANLKNRKSFYSGPKDAAEWVTIKAESGQVL